MLFLQLVIKTLFSQSFAALALFLVGVITARLLGAADRGLYVLFFTSASVLSMLLYLGMTQANVYFLNRAGVDRQRLISNSLAFVIFHAALLGMVLLMIDYDSVQSGGVRLTEDLILLLFITSLVTLGDTLFSGIALGLQRYTIFVQNLLIQSTLILLVTIPLFVIELSVYQIIFLRVLASITAAILLTARILHVSRYRTALPDLKLLLRQLSFGIRSYVQNVLGLLSYRVYFFLLAFFTDDETVGVFSVAVLMLEAIRFIPEAVGTILFPELAKSSQPDAADLMTSRVTRTVLAISVLTTLGIFTLSSPIVLLIFGNEYHNAITLLRIMTLGVGVGILYQVLSRYFTSRFHQHKTILSAGIGLIVGVLLSLYLIPRIGAIGAAISFSAANIAAGGTMAMLFKRTTGFSYRSFLLMNKDDIATARNGVSTWLKLQRSAD